ncbi:unnamed protein product [Adineta ricciae]|uniref:RING-type domain-containing protein n=1 Tax=Adineta ricciae TaxID=249248 RepID=A0A813PA95_ADIRI|nr:unnamed protein product [Adineta ricciae]
MTFGMISHRYYIGFNIHRLKQYKLNYFTFFARLSSVISGGVNRILSHFTTVYHPNADRAGENRVTPTSTSSTIPITTQLSSPAPPEAEDSTWISTFTKVDRLLSGSSLHLMYRIIDITILLIGLTSSKHACQMSNRLAITSICLLIFYFIDLTIILLLFIRNITPRNSNLSEEQKVAQLRSASALRGFFVFFKLIPVCVGTGYSFSPGADANSGCELIRFCLGIVCLSTWLLILIPPTKPELPVRRSFIVECFILVFVLTINLTYIGTVATAMKDVGQSTCIYNNSEDLYLRSPLKSYAFVGLILFGCTTIIHIVNLTISQLCLRLNRGRQIYIRYYVVQYIVNYVGAIAVIYYFSVGALFLFQPRSGQPCRADAPELYRILLIWEWIRILSPLIAIPLICILCCLGVFFGVILSYCLPASITVPLLESLRGWLSAAPMTINTNPPASQENIDALPTISFGQESDQFNQTDCAICRSNFEANEQLKKLQCGHLFHPECVTNWLLITRICPICRQRMSVTNL